jgi:hypothetical protein
MCQGWPRMPPYSLQPCSCWRWLSAAVTVHVLHSCQQHTGAAWAPRCIQPQHPSSTQAGSGTTSATMPRRSSPALAVRVGYRALPPSWTVMFAKRPTLCEAVLYVCFAPLPSPLLPSPVPRWRPGVRRVTDTCSSCSGTLCSTRWGMAGRESDPTSSPPLHSWP